MPALQGASSPLLRSALSLGEVDKNVNHQHINKQESLTMKSRASIMTGMGRESPTGKSKRSGPLRKTSFAEEVLKSSNFQQLRKIRLEKERQEAKEEAKRKLLMQRTLE